MSVLHLSRFALRLGPNSFYCIVPRISDHRALSGFFCLLLSLLVDGYYEVMALEGVWFTRYGKIVLLLVRP